MPRPTERAEVLARLRKTIASGKAILGAGAGIGLSAKFVEKGGADLIIIYNSGRFRMAGRGSLAGMMPYGDANAVVLDMAPEILTVVESTPVLAGVCATDPYHSMPQFLKRLKDMGFCGVQNFPTVGLIDGNFRRALEVTGMSYEKEVEMVVAARRFDLLTAVYVFDVDEAERMTRAGADVVVIHLGLTTGGSIGAEEGDINLDIAARVVQEIRDAIVRIRSDVIVLCHGGPISGVEETRFVLRNVRGIHGFFGASSLERLPVETALEENARMFKNIDITSG